MQGSLTGCESQFKWSPVRQDRECGFDPGFDASHWEGLSARGGCLESPRLGREESVGEGHTGSVLSC